VPRESTLNELVAEAAGKASYPLLISVSAFKGKEKENERTTSSTNNRMCRTTRNIIEGSKKKF
jgi:hypothetical protein